MNSALAHNFDSKQPVVDAASVASPCCCHFRWQVPTALRQLVLAEPSWRVPVSVVSPCDEFPRRQVSLLRHSSWDSWRIPRFAKKSRLHQRLTHVSIGMHCTSIHANTCPMYWHVLRYVLWYVLVVCIEYIQVCIQY